MTSCARSAAASASTPGSRSSTPTSTPSRATTTTTGSCAATTSSRRWPRSSSRCWRRTTPAVTSRATSAATTSSSSPSRPWARRSRPRSPVDSTRPSRRSTTRSTASGAGSSPRSATATSCARRWCRCRSAWSSSSPAATAAPRRWRRAPPRSRAWPSGCPGRNGCSTAAGPRSDSADAAHFLKQEEGRKPGASIARRLTAMSEVTTVLPPGQPDDARSRRVKVVVHRLDGGLEDGESDARTIAGEGFPLYSTHDPTRRRRSDILEAAARQGRDLNKLANDFRDRLALIRDAGLTTGDTIAFSRAVRTHLDKFLLEDNIVLNPQEKSALADIILRAAVGYGPLDSLLHDRSVSEIMVNGPDQIFIERRGVLTKAEVRFEDENQLLETIRRMVATTGRHIDGLNPMVDARLPDGSRVNAIIRPAAIHGPALTIRKFKDAVRGIEALDMLQAMNTGHDGSMSTIHSNSARDALSRLETMVMMASIDIPFEAVRAQIASAVNLIVHQARMPDGRRKVAQIAEVVGYDTNGAVLRDIFLLGMGPDLRLEYNATGYVPTALDKAAFYGVQVNQDLFDPVKSRFIPAGSDSMMPVVKDPLLAGAGKTENVVRQVFVVPFSSDRPAPPATATAGGAAAPQVTAQTPEMQEEMRKLIDAARTAVTDLQAAAPAPAAAAPPAAPIVYPVAPPQAPGAVPTL